MWRALDDSVLACGDTLRSDAPGRSETVLGSRNLYFYEGLNAGPPQALKEQVKQHEFYRTQRACR